jgi:positive regulator of sigma E activity
MASPQGRILSIYPDADPPCVAVEIAAAPICSRCASGKGCGAGIFSGDERPRSVDALLARGLAVREGDRVSIELAPDNLLRAALLVYGLPLTGAITASAVAWLLGADDLIAAAMAVVGTGLGMMTGRVRLRKSRCLRNFVPTVTARLSGASD